MNGLIGSDTESVLVDPEELSEMESLIENGTYVVTQLITSRFNLGLMSTWRAQSPACGMKRPMISKSIANNCSGHA